MTTAPKLLVGYLQRLMAHARMLFPAWERPGRMGFVNSKLQNSRKHNAKCILNTVTAACADAELSLEVSEEW
jgi:hypothetical protein